MGFTRDVPMVELVVQRFLEEGRAYIRRQNQLASECYSSQGVSQADVATRLAARSVPNPTRYPTQEKSEEQTATDHEGPGRERTTEIQPAQTEQAYPTAAAERKRNAKRAAKAAGEEWVTKPRYKPVENHHDDCGEDFSAIESSLSHYGSALSDDELTETDSDEEYDYIHAQCGIEQFSLLEPNLIGTPRAGQGVMLYASAGSLLSHLATL